MPAKVLLVDDELYLMSFMMPTMQNNYEMSVASNATQVREQLARERFDVVLLDLDLNDNVSGLDLLPEIRETTAKVIVVSARCTPQAALACLRNGIRAFVDKHEFADALIPTIERVLAGQQVFPDAWLATLNDKTVTPLPDLDLTERKVLDLLSIDPSLTNAAIGEALHKSESCIKKCVSELFGKFDIKGRFNLVYEARQRGYLPNLLLPRPTTSPKRGAALL